MYFGTLQEQFEIQKKAIDALKRIRGNRIEENSKHKIPKRPRYEMIFEEYSDDSFESKAKYDSYVLEKLMESVKDDDKIEQINEYIVEMLQYVRKIYEHINIKPAIYGPRNVLFESEEDYDKQATRLINEYINKNYYDLSSEERDARYKDKVIQEAKDYITYQKIEPKEAVDKAQKRIIYEQFLHRLAFPLIVDSNIKDLLESTEYDMFFDKETLVKLYEAFEQKVREISELLV